MRFIRIAALAALALAIPMAAGAQDIKDIIVPTAGIKKNFERDWREFRDAQRDLQSTKRYNDLKSRPSRRTADRLRDSENYARYVKMYWLVRMNPLGPGVNGRERDFYNDLQRRLRRELGSGWDIRLDDRG